MAAPKKHNWNWGCYEDGFKPKKSSYSIRDMPDLSHVELEDKCCLIM